MALCIAVSDKTYINTYTRVSSGLEMCGALRNQQKRREHKGPVLSKQQRMQKEAH